ncbi:MAG: hypothetical protein J0I98_05030 [Mesorhizobium sp.]|nr:hypothetical protein [Mesorhizobium sp.]MBN9242137.1 hypothetical protein [Mesorhizobium sp.]
MTRKDTLFAGRVLKYSACLKRSVEVGHGNVHLKCTLTYGIGEFIPAGRWWLSRNPGTNVSKTIGNL